MRFIKILLLILFSINIQNTSNAADMPASFADLAEKLMPSVVNISTTTTITTRSNPFPFDFPPGSPFEDMFKDYGTPQKRQTSALGSGFIIDEKGIVITNNHVIKGAEDVFVRVNGEKNIKAKVIGADPGMDLAVLQIESDEMVKAARDSGVYVKYVLFEDAGHGFAKKQQQIQGYGKILVFLDKYLKL